MNPGIYTIESVHGFRETIVLENFRVGPQPVEKAGEQEPRLDLPTPAEPKPREEN